MTERPASPSQRAQDRASEEQFIARIDGLYVGMLDDAELAAFNDLFARGLMQRSYEHTGGFLGLAKAIATPPHASSDHGATGDHDLTATERR